MKYKIEKKNLYKRNKNEIRNQKNDDWNWKIKNKKDNHALYLGGERKKRPLTTIQQPYVVMCHTIRKKTQWCFQRHSKGSCLDIGWHRTHLINGTDATQMVIINSPKIYKE